MPTTERVDTMPTTEGLAASLTTQCALEWLPNGQDAKPRTCKAAELLATMAIELLEYLTTARLQDLLRWLTDKGDEGAINNAAAVANLDDLFQALGDESDWAVVELAMELGADSLYGCDPDEWPETLTGFAEAALTPVLHLTLDEMLGQSLVPLVEWLRERPAVAEVAVSLSSNWGDGLDRLLEAVVLLTDGRAAMAVA